MNRHRVLGWVARTRPVAWTLVALAVVSVVVSIVLDGLAGPQRRALADTDPGLSSTSVGLVVVVFGSVILSARRRHPVGVVMVGFGLLWSVDGVLESFIPVGLSASPPWPGTSFAFWFVARVGAFLLVGLPLLFVLYPDGRLPSGRWRALGIVSVVAALVLPVALLVTPLTVLYAEDGGPPPGVQLDPLVLPLPIEVAYAVLVVARLVTYAALLASVLVVLVRYRRASAEQQRQLRWLLWAAIVCVLTVVLSLLLPSSTAAYAALLIAVTTTCASVTIGIVKPDLADIDALVSATVVYALVAAVVIAVDLGLLGLAARVLGDRINQQEVTLAALIVAVAIYGPLRHWLWSVAERVLVGRRADRYGVVSRLAARLESTDAVEDQLPALTSAVAESFKLSYVGVEVVQPGGGTVAAAYGVEPERTQTLPIAYQGLPVGRLVLPTRGLRSMLSHRDQLLLLDVVRQAAIAIRNATLARELQESRERLVLDREEDRRRIRRDLHDGLGPVLGGVAMRLDAAGNAVAVDPDRATVLIKQARTEVSDALTDVRRLVHGLRPPALDDLGLLAAVEQQADRLRTDSFAVTVEAAELPPLPAAAEVAAFRIASEALANVVRHAEAGRAAVRFVATGTDLLVEVIDDGRGIAADRAAGVGLVSIRERTAELGGRFEVVCPEQGGTVVRAWLPCLEGAAR